MRGRAGPRPWHWKLDLRVEEGKVSGLKPFQRDGTGPSRTAGSRGSSPAGGTGLDLYADTARRLPLTDPDSREMVISCGAALFNVRLAMRHLVKRAGTAAIRGSAAPARFLPI